MATSGSAARAACVLVFEKERKEEMKSSESGRFRWSGTSILWGTSIKETSAPKGPVPKALRLRECAAWAARSGCKALADLDGRAPRAWRDSFVERAWRLWKRAARARGCPRGCGQEAVSQGFLSARTKRIEASRDWPFKQSLKQVPSRPPLAVKKA